MFLDGYCIVTFLAPVVSFVSWGPPSPSYIATVMNFAYFESTNSLIVKPTKEANKVAKMSEKGLGANEKSYFLNDYLVPFVASLFSCSSILK